MARIVPATDENVRFAADLLRSGDLVSFPTETVYGLGADASNTEAVKRVFAAKGRPAAHPLIVHIGEADYLNDWVEAVPEEAVILARYFWPGPLTIVLQRANRVPLEVTGGQETVAVRVPSHPVARRLLQRFGGGLAAPSANRFGHISPTSAQHVASEFGDELSLVLDGGPAEVGVESTIVDLSGEQPRILRPGGISRAQVARALARELEGNPGGSAPRVPGALERHYSPSSPLELVGPDRLESRLFGEDVSVLATSPAPAHFAGRWLRLPDEPRGYARALYAALRELDALGLPIVVEEPPRGPEWEAIRDRLQRASAGRGMMAEERRT